jgi:hypothetical protein
MDSKKPPGLAPLLRAPIEVGFIVFLYYLNLLMGDYERSRRARTRGLA